MFAANDSLDTLNIVKMSFTLYAVFCKAPLITLLSGNVQNVFLSVEMHCLLKPIGFGYI